MKVATLLHNQKAGDGKHTKETLTKLIESRGYICHYLPVEKKNWIMDIDPDTDFIVVAGGDGTIRKVAGQLLFRKETDKKLPVAIFPLGTANNIARSLDIKGTLESIVDSWAHCGSDKHDIGRIHNLPEHSFFLESVGFGLFPAFLRNMKQKSGLLPKDPGKQIKIALKEFAEMTCEYKAKHCNLIIDGKDYSGDYLMIEIMNTESIGPALKLNPATDMTDGKLDVVLVSRSKRAQLEKYINSRRRNAQPKLQLDRIQAHAISLAWKGVRFHVDDMVVKQKKGSELKISVLNGFIDFIVPGKSLMLLNAA